MPRKSEQTANKEHCKCRPICKNRRREWKGETQNTSAELLIERKPKPDCYKYLHKTQESSIPCPLYYRRRSAAQQEPLGKSRALDRAVRICSAPINDAPDTPYLRYAELAKKIGAWQSVRARCPYCECVCCACSNTYLHEDPAQCKTHIRHFDARVFADPNPMRIMYDPP